MDDIRLKQLLNEFAILAVDSIPVQYSDETEPSALTIPELFEVWCKEPDCMLSPMFSGYCLGEGEDINSYSPHELHLAIYREHQCLSGAVDFDWIGDCHAPYKPH